MKGRMYELFKARVEAIDKGQPFDIKKAGTDYEISGTYTPTDALNLFDATQKVTGIVSKIRRVDCTSSKYNLNKFVNRGVIVGRASAATGAAAVRAGNDVSGLTKDNIGNQGVLKELYHLFNLTPSDLTNWARIGRDRFQTSTQAQISEDWAYKLESLLFTGDGGDDQPTGLVKRCQDNLASSKAEEDSGKKVRNVDVSGESTMIAKLDLIYQKAPIRNRKNSIIFISDEDYQDYVDELIASSGFDSTKAIFEDTDMFAKYKKATLVPTPDLAQGKFIMTRYEDIAWCIAVDTLTRTTDIQNVPMAILYSLMGEWEFEFTTYDRVVYGYTTTP